VKSLLGERLDRVDVAADGLRGDRQFALFNVETGLGRTAGRIPQLLFASATVQLSTFLAPRRSRRQHAASTGPWLTEQTEVTVVADITRSHFENYNV
jgi:uncharacterized protein YcbX